jgi:ABC-type dipeptide/oligopeptide/nickel transport system permease subunit
LTEIAKRPGPVETLRRARDGGDGSNGDGPPDQPSQPDREFTVEARSQRQMVVRRFLHHKLAMTSLVLLVVVAVTAFVFPLFWKYNYKSILPTAESNAHPSWKHPFGTDTIGHDMLAQTLRGTQKSIEIAILVAIGSTIIGVLVGAASGYFRGFTDAVLMRFTDLMLVIPVLAIAATLGYQIKGGGSSLLIAMVLTAFFWMGTARIIRGEFLSLREKEFVEAARASGASDRRIIFKHMLPNVVGPMIVSATLAVASAILVETALSFVGAGVKDPDTSLGLLVATNQRAFNTRPWLFWYPGLIIIIIALTINFIGDGLRDAFDPKQTRVRA